MNLKLSRRNFAGSAAALLALPSSASAAGKPAGVKLGVCSYSFTNKMTLAQSIQAVKALGLRGINIKPEFHLPYASSPAEITAA